MKNIRSGVGSYPDSFLLKDVESAEKIFNNQNGLNQLKTFINLYFMEKH